MKPLPSGYYLRLQLLGLPILVHWTAPAVGAGVAFMGIVMHGPLTFVVSLWLAAFAVVVIHELGHAMAGRIVGAEVVGIVLTGVGGLCLMKLVTPLSASRRLLVDAGGWCAQALLFALTLLASRPWGTPGTPVIESLTFLALVSTNLIMFVCSAIPTGENDGAKVLSLLRTMFRHRAG